MVIDMKIKDIAKELHLSVSTVSKALNGAFDISKETKELVLAYAKKHGYKSKDERLAVRKKRRLCFLFLDINNPTHNNVFYSLASSFTKYASLNNFEVVQQSVETLNTTYEKFMNDNNFDGALIAGLTSKDPLKLQIRNTSIPTVLYDNISDGDKIATISNENLNAISQLVTYLYGLGHRKIGFIHGDRNSFVSNERFSGYITGQIMNNLEYNPNYVYFGAFSEKSGHEASEFFAKTDVTAVICASDMIAIGLIRGLNEKGIKVPEDISVTGYDGLDIAKYFNPSITTIKQDYDLLGERAFYLLTSMMKNRSNQRIVINGELIIGDSVSKAKE